VVVLAQRGRGVALTPVPYRRLALHVDDDGVATATLGEAAAGPVFDEALLEDLIVLGQRVAGDARIRVLVLTGEQETFSAGGDADWLRRMRDDSIAGNVALSLRLEGMYRGLDRLPQPVVGRLNGDALAAGTGLAAVCDIAIAVDDARFGFGDTHIGLAPAVVAPYFVAKVGPSFARAVFLTCERFDAHRALVAGLVHEVVTREGLDRAVTRAVSALLRGGPVALAAAKRLPAEVHGRDPASVALRNAELVSGLRAGDEGQEGTSALLEGRLPRWAVSRA
jgi:methylglutaconyl-CoA hydratase